MPAESPAPDPANADPGEPTWEEKELTKNQKVHLPVETGGQINSMGGVDIARLYLGDAEPKESGNTYNVQEFRIMRMTDLGNPHYQDIIMASERNGFKTSRLLLVAIKPEGGGIAATAFLPENNLPETLGREGTLKWLEYGIEDGVEANHPAGWTSFNDNLSVSRLQARLQTTNYNTMEITGQTDGSQTKIQAPRFLAASSPH